MIFYFSATGNSKRTAERLAEALNTTAVSIENYDAAQVPDTDEYLGLVFPTFHVGMPLNVQEFVETAALPKAKYTFIVSTYGGNTGKSNIMAGEVLESRGYHVNAYFSIRWPDNWTITYDLTNPERVQHFVDLGESEVDEMIPIVQSRQDGDFSRNTMVMDDSVHYHGEYDEARKTSHLHVLDRCIGCSLCARRCPVKAIEMVDKKPHWVKDQCLMCLGCLHRCPVFAIQYDDTTEAHGQYKNPNTGV